MSNSILYVRFLRYRSISVIFRLCMRSLSGFNVVYPILQSCTTGMQAKKIACLDDPVVIRILMRFHTRLDFRIALTFGRKEPAADTLNIITEK